MYTKQNNRNSKEKKPFEKQKKINLSHGNETNKQKLFNWMKTKYLIMY